MGIRVEIHKGALLIHCSQIELEFRNVGFCGGKTKPEYPAKNARSKDEHQQHAGSEILTRADKPQGMREKIQTVTNSKWWTTNQIFPRN